MTRPVIITLIGALIAIGLFIFFMWLRATCMVGGACIKDWTGMYNDTAPSADFLGTIVPVPAYVPPQQPVLGAKSVLGEKRIFVDLTEQRMYAVEGSQIIYDFPVSSGKFGWTPTGSFRIWGKYRYVHMSGGNQALGTAYNLPNVPYVLFFEGDGIRREQGFSFHGTYWHKNFGHPMSHGCINLRTEDAEKLYDWVEPDTQGNVTTVSESNQGTPVYIYGEAPGQI